MERRNQVTVADMARGRAMEARTFESASCGGDKMVWAEVAIAWERAAETLERLDALDRASRWGEGPALQAEDSAIVGGGIFEYLRPIRALEARALARAA